MEFLPEIMVIDTNAEKTDNKNQADRYPVHNKTKICYFCGDW